MMSNFEKNETPEQILVRMLREKGFDNPESCKLLLEWTMEQEKLAEQSGDYIGAQILLNIKRAKIYRDAGNADAAREAFADAAEHAWNEHRDELYGQIIAEMEKVEATDVQ